MSARVHAGQPRPFTVDVGEDVLVDLRERLARTRWPAQLPDTGWDLGADLAQVREVCDRWADGYDWRAAEARLNALPQVLVEVDGLDLHAIHVPGVGPDDGPDPVPVVMTHGWPGSVWEFMGLVGPLTDPAAHGGDAADAVTLVLPSLPGFGFSAAPTERGWGPTRAAHAIDALMGALGHDAYVAQGGDWGGIVSSQLGALHPDRCRAVHLNMTVASPPDDPSPALVEEIRRQKRFHARESAYFQVQSTKPDSLTLAQHDSPAGLAAWILEKFHGWSDDGDRLADVFDVDDLISNLMLYWATGATPSAARIYAESTRDAAMRDQPPVDVPTGVAHFPAEPFTASREMSEHRYRIASWHDMPAGGHFAAMQRPDLLAGDLQGFVREHRELFRDA